jgi:hypothetical protein
MAELKWQQYLANSRMFVLNNYPPYQMEVVKYLNLIRTTHSGRVLFKHLDQGKPWIAIQPYKPTAQDPVNAYADFEDENKAYTKNQVITRSYDLPVIGKLKLPIGFGTGEGTNVSVFYHPANQAEYVKRMHWIPPGSGPGETLFHELIHALRMAQGVFIRTDVPEKKEMDDFEEFCAIVAANIYRSERGFKLLRDSHWGYDPVNKDLSNPEHYYQYYKDEIVKWFASQKAFCLELAQGTAAFNPLRVAAVDLGFVAPRPAAAKAGR